MLEVTAKPGGNGRGRGTHNGADNSHNAILVNGLLGAEERLGGVSTGIGHAQVHLALESGFFLGENHALDSRRAEFGIVARKGGEHQDRRHTGAAVFQGFKSLFGGVGEVFGYPACNHLLVPVTSGLVALGILAFAADLQLHPAHDVFIDRVFFQKGLQLFSRQKRSGQRLNGDFLGAAASGRVLGVGQNAEHGFDTFVNAAFFDQHNRMRQFHAFAVNRVHVVFQEARRKLQGFVALVFTQVAFGKHHRSLFASGLTEARLVDLLERGDCLGTLAVLD